jgi:endonuclease III related protein
MSRASKPEVVSRVQAQRLRRFHDVLLAAYGPQEWWPAETRLEVVVGAYLTQNTAWRSVERSIGNLKTHGLLTFEGLLSVDESLLRQLIRPSGYMIRKAAAIKAFVAFLDRDFGGSLDRLAAQPTLAVRKALLALPGVGEETADAILLYALGHPVMVVDEYLRRITIRHNLLPAAKKYADVQRLAEQAFLSEPAAGRTAAANEFHALVVAVGKQHCGTTAKCEGCPLEGM